MARTWSGVLARLGIPTGDGRILAPGSMTSRDLPLPLLWQERSEDGHGGSMVVGRIETLAFGDGMVTATGSLLESAPYAVEEQLEAGVIGPSVDLDDVDYVMDDEERIVITRGRIAGATLVSIPAFADVSITLDPFPAEPVGVAEPGEDYSPLYEDGRRRDLDWEPFALQASVHAYVPSPHSNAGNCTCGMTEHSTVHPHEYAAADQAPGCVCSKPEDHELHSGVLTASAAPVPRPPADWFARPDLDQLTPVTVSDSGRVFGHIAGWSTCHVGLPGCVTAPSSPSGYAYFHQGEQACADGSTRPVGTLTVGGGHADAQLAWRPALEHYDNVGAAVAKVAAGEDEFGIWVAGWMLPQATPEQVEAFRSSPVSGDWRRIGGALEMIAVCSVNAPGFPIPRARVSFASGAQQTLVASGLQPTAEDGDHFTQTTKAITEARARWAWAQATTKGR